jgi:DNA-binding Lrp family transcriptional regulator
MDVENEFIKPVVLFYYNEGLDEHEARVEITKKYGPYGITMRTINKWYDIFRSEEDMSDRKPASSIHRISDEYLIDLVNENPDLNMAELGKLAGTSATVISIKLREINSAGERVKYIHKPSGKAKIFTDDYLINLAKENPGITVKELSTLAGASFSVVSRRVKKINTSEERIKCEPKNVGKPKKFTDEFLINLANENPDVSLTELSSLAGASVTAVSRRIDKINSSEERIKFKSRKAGVKSKFSDEYLVNLVNTNPGLTMQELGELIGISVSAMSNRLAKIKNKGVKLQYSYKSCKYVKFEECEKPKVRISNQYIIDLVNENPELSIRELARLTETSESTVSRKIRVIKDSGQLLDYGNKKIPKDKSILIRSPESMVDESPGHNLVELAKSADTNIKVVSNRRRKTNCGKKEVDEDSKKYLQLVSDEAVINLFNNNPNLNLEELSKLIGTSARTLSRRLKQINSNGDVINYVKKKTIPKTGIKITEKSLINLVNENPGLTMEELANLADVSTATISKRLKKINCEDMKANYIYKDSRKV